MLSQKPWKLEGLLRLVMSVLLSLAFMVMLSGLVQHFTGIKPDDHSLVSVLINTLALDGSFLVAVFIFLRLEHVSWANAFGFKSPGLILALLWGVIVAACFLPIGVCLNGLCIKLFEMVHVHAQDQQAVETLKNAAPGLNRGYLIFFAVIFAPISEEAFFRGIIYPTIKQSGYPRAALWGTSLLFAAIHLNAAAFLPLTLLAIALTILYEKTNNLLACIVTHSLFNAANVFLLYLFQDPVTHPPY